MDCLKRPFQIITCDRPEHLKGGRTEVQLFCKVKCFDDNKFFSPLFLPIVGNIVFIAQFVDNPSSYTYFFFFPGTAWNLKLLFAACQLQNNLSLDASRHSSWNAQKEYVKVKCIIFSLYCTASIDCIELYPNCFLKNQWKKILSSQLCFIMVLLFFL